MADNGAICKKCGKKYPRWRADRNAICEAIVHTPNGFKRCCGSIIEAVVEVNEESTSQPKNPGWPPPVTDGAVY